MADGNGPTRREFDNLAKELDDLDRNGSRATRELQYRVGNLERRLDGHDSNWTWMARGIIGIIFLVMGTIVILSVSGVLSGGN